MPRPRFERLEPARRDAIFDAAAAEFGEHGFERASYNRIIERAGLSKGAMYYYFDDKRDLFVTLVADVVTELFDQLESMGEVDGVEAYWARVQELCVMGWSLMIRAPRVAKLVPALLDPRNASDVPEAMAVMNERAAAWTEDLLRRGRAVGAVRDDLPDDLLMAVTMSVGMALDRWIGQQVLTAESPAPELSGEVMAVVIDLLRRLLAPA